MSRWAYACLFSAAFAGCGDACVRDSDCGSGRVCSAGACVVIDAGPGGDGTSGAEATPDAGGNQPMDAIGGDGGVMDGPMDTVPADLTDAGPDGGSDA